MRDTEALQRARQAFADQFEAADDGVVYRRRGKGEPVAMTAWERDVLIDDFNRRIGDLYLAAVVLIAVVLALAGAGVAMFRLRPTLPAVALILAPAGLAYFGLDAWIWAAPRRLIAKRAGGLPSA